MKTIIKNGRVIDPANNLDTLLDIAFQDGKITEVGPNLSHEGAEIIDATGLWVVPGLIDMHVHLRDPGAPHKETIASGSRAAAAGGFTTICAMPNTAPVTDNEVVVEYILARAAKTAAVHVLPIGSITKNLDGLELSQMGEMAQAGICAVSDDGKTVEDPALLRTAMQYAKMFNLPVLCHCEDPRLGQGLINAGDHANLLGFKGILPQAEEIIVARDIILQRGTGAHLHICHVSATGSLFHIREAKRLGAPVTAEVCPHHFTLCDEDITDYDPNFKMSPPLRGKTDMAALKAALADGTIDVIATDHAPHHDDDKQCEFQQAANGIIGLETAVPLCVSELVEPGILTPSQMIAKLTANPARILGLGKGTLSPGCCADITLINPTDSYQIDKNAFASISRNTPFHGRRVRGRVIKTIVEGATQYAYR